MWKIKCGPLLLTHSHKISFLLLIFRKVNRFFRRFERWIRYPLRWGEDRFRRLCQWWKGETSRISKASVARTPEYVHIWIWSKSLSHVGEDEQFLLLCSILFGFHQYVLCYLICSILFGFRVYIWIYDFYLGKN